jgi:hypothetical protein
VLLRFEGDALGQEVVRVLVVSQREEQLGALVEKEGVLWNGLQKRNVDLKRLFQIP